MKITKSQLKQLIKEEYTDILENEADVDPESDYIQQMENDIEALSDSITEIWNVLRANKMVK